MSSDSEHVPVLGYWGYRGVSVRWDAQLMLILSASILLEQFGQQIRLLLEYTGTKFEDRKFTGDDWFEVMYKMGFDFPNLPFYVEGEMLI